MHGFILCIPGEDLIVAVLEIPLLLLPHGVYQLVLVEVENFVQSGQVWPQGYQLTQVECTASKQSPA